MDVQIVLALIAAGSSIVVKLLDRPEDRQPGRRSSSSIVSVVLVVIAVALALSWAPVRHGLVAALNDPSWNSTPSPSASSTSSRPMEDPSSPTTSEGTPSPTATTEPEQVELNRFFQHLRTMLDTNDENPELLRAFYKLPVDYLKYGSLDKKELAEHLWEPRTDKPGAARWHDTCSPRGDTFRIAVTVPLDVPQGQAKKPPAHRTYTLVRVAGAGEPFRISAVAYGLC